jgi:hypothetical protein
MRKVLVLSFCLLFALTAIAFARDVPQGEKQIRVETPQGVIDLDLPLEMQGLQASAQADTFWLGRWDFDTAVGNCTDDGWAPADITAQLDCFFHVDDFVGLGGGSYGRLVPIEGNQSLWVGVRGTEFIACGYLTPPGYGSAWDQSFVFKCITASTAEFVTIGYHIVYDSEPGYDYTFVEYVSKSTCDSIDDIDEVAATDWVTLATYDYVGDSVAVDTIPAGHAGSITIRFHMSSDGGWSDEDGLWDTDGASVIDEISVDGEVSGNYDTENFEDEAPGDKQTLDGDWQCQTLTGYSQDGMARDAADVMNCDLGTQYYACVYPGLTLVQEDPCYLNMTCCWAWISGSTETYACGGYPFQRAVPKENSRGQFITEEIWSPELDWDLGGVAWGSTAEIRFRVYRDLTIPDLMFYVWHVRSIDAAGCPGAWRDRNFVYYGANKDWWYGTQDVGDLIEGTADKVQMALGSQDMCGYWYLVYGDCACHSHSPLFDDIAFYRIGNEGPVWSARDLEMFQDTWSTAGDEQFGCGRVDVAIDRAATASAAYYAGDSALVTMSDPVSGLGLDGNCRGAAAYCYVNLRLGPLSPPFNPFGLEGWDDCGNRWPYNPAQDRVCIDGTYWYAYCMDTVYTEPAGCFTGVVPDKFCVDFNDCYVMAMDTLEFFFGAMNSIGQWSFWSQGAGTSNDFDEVCVLPMEMQVLPGAGWYRGGDILYVDQFSGRGAQPHFDRAFQHLGIFDYVDRFDKRGPTSLQGNGVGMLCNNWTLKLIDKYWKIIWNSGNMSAGTVGDNLYPGAVQDKSPDCQALDFWLENHTNWTAGIYFSGDDMAEEWLTLPCMSGFAQKYIPYTLITGDHNDLHEVSPIVVGVPAGYDPPDVPPSCGIFDHGVPFGVDTLIAYGGCPIINDFDVIDPEGYSTLEMTYDDQKGPPDTTLDHYNPAVIAAEADTVNIFGNRTQVVLSGFSFHYIRDDRPQHILDQVHHLQDILTWFGNEIADPTPVVVTPKFSNSLAQNYPNPFNPSTTIKYSIKERAHVTLKIYNVAGQLVKTLVNEEQSPRAEGFAVRWNSRSNSGNPVSSGVYFYKLVTKNFTQTKKMVLLK